MSFVYNKDGVMVRCTDGRLRNTRLQIARSLRIDFSYLGGIVDKVLSTGGAEGKLLPQTPELPAQSLVTESMMMASKRFLV